MIQKLQGRLTLITGASPGVGRAIAIGLAEAGADVLFWIESEQESRHKLS
jgi:NAD(P)-dependent dehydrogenase (short-subunit alcohol dehydrogenase family)